MGKTERRDLDKALELSMKERWDEAIAKLEILETSADTEVRDLALNYLYAATGRNADAEAMLRRSIEGRGTANDGLGSQLAVLAPVVMRQVASTKRSRSTCMPSKCSARTDPRSR